MPDTALHMVNRDLEKFVKDAQALFLEAKNLTGDKALEAQQRGMKLLDTALARVQDARTSAVQSGKEMVSSADHYVKENPWRTVTAAASIGLLLGVILGRR